MLKNQNIICISSIDWDFIWQGHQEIMSTLAREGNRVLFIENTGVRMPGIRDFSRIKSRIKNWFAGVKGIRQVMPNLYVFSPIVLPFPYFRPANWFNRRLILAVLNKWARIMNFSDPLAWVFLPTPLSLSIIESVNPKLVIYYCIDNFRVSSSAARKIEKSEIRLLKRSDLVFTTSKELYSYCSKLNRNTHIFPFAVSFRKFEEIRQAGIKDEPEIKGLKRPVVGYVGGIHKWLDFNLIKETALKFPEYSFVFVGPLQADISLLAGQKNIHFLGAKSHSRIPGLINSFDACVIPYLITDYTRNVYPTKLNEYHALGKPVISTALPEIIDFNRENGNLVFVANNTRGFMEMLQEALKPGDSQTAAKRIACAKKNSWESRIAQMEALINDAVNEKMGVPVDWQESIKRIYRAWRVKALKTAACVLCAYLLIFYTPLIWIAAEPLKITQQPEKADCILVFAGGVGESGKAGQGYEERVQQAVGLYRRGFAQWVIFSSGHTFVFEEPQVMKAIAVSLGVPQERIILEDKAKNTYENVKFSNNILEKNNWHSILLVSSPYHMRRASLVLKKNAPRIEVIYAPGEASLFYSHPERDKNNRKVWKRASLAQIKGILHEYAGILYYKLKGYI